MNAALRATGVVGAEFDEYELEALDAACAAADRVSSCSGCMTGSFRVRRDRRRWRG